MSRRKRKAKKIVRTIMRWLAYGCWLAAAVVILFPLLSSWIFEKNADKQFEEYQQNVMKQSWEIELKEAEAYNQKLSEKGSFYYDAFDDEVSIEEEVYRSLLNADEEGTMGYISIPEISVQLPIYHGTDENVLEKGCGHMEGSSLPVGGTSTHAVVCAHTGLGTAELFTNLDQLEIGDEFLISIFGLELKYKVDEIKVVLPDQMDDLTIVEGEDLVTLVTCTPYGINSHRLLVRGKRV
ncbi:MAG: class C sortase [Lachnospiraceae bacterium]|nr:class C sortase [Lachnospiraceae bacterium]